MSVLDKVPMATVLSLAAIATGVYLIGSGQFDLSNPDDFLKFFGGLGALIYGAGKLGEARNGAGHGVS